MVLSSVYQLGERRGRRAVVGISARRWSPRHFAACDLPGDLAHLEMASRSPGRSREIVEVIPGIAIGGSTTANFSLWRYTETH